VALLAKTRKVFVSELIMRFRGKTLSSSFLLIFYFFR